jgi:hypothetical protein
MSLTVFSCDPFLVAAVITFSCSVSFFLGYMWGSP